MANRMPDENRHLAPAIGILLILLAARATGDTTPHVERWGLWDMTLDGPANGNPYVEVRLTATFERGDRRIIVPGFWDGGDTYRIRFSPPEEGEWRFVTGSNRPEMDGRRGKLTAVAPAGTNHGPVQIFKTSCLRYADGSPYHQFGTTCYAWTHQPDALQRQTLRTLADAPFNKIRFCVFPKSYAYNTNEPSLVPFARRPDRTFDFDRPDPTFWRQFEGRILDLQRLGIEADIILWHPYDRWGFSEMLKEQDDRYLRYSIARLSAFRNVWWSLANEYDLMAPGAMKGHRGNKTMEDWDRFFQILQQEDPHQRLRSIHNCRGFYDHTRPWVTHASLQTSDMNAGIRFRAQFGKPVIYDECKYEGDVPQGWGNLTPREMMQRFWLGTLGGCYVGHGETYLHPEDILWWSKGGELHGKSAERIQWLRDFMAKAPPFHDFQPAGDDKGRFLLAKPAEYYLLYARSTQPQALDLGGERPYKVDRIDPWEMVISPLGTARPGARDFAPPQANMVYRFVPYAPDEPLRPEAAIDAAPDAGRAPLSVRFSAPAGLEARWDFGDGSVSDESAPAHVFAKPGLYVVTLTVTDAHDGRATAVREVAVDRDPSAPLLRLGFPGGETHALRLSGTAERTGAGGFRFPDGAPWGWAETGVVDDLRGLRSFTIGGWLKPDSLAVGAGGNRILFCLNHDRDGIDLVCHTDGRLRLAVNQWPDRISNDSSPGKLVPGRWTLISVAYDGTRERDNVRWSFSAPLDAPDPAAIPVPDRTTSHAAGPVGRDIGPLAIGNFNATLRGAGLDRQFRGEIRDLTLFGSRADDARASLSFRTTAPPSPPAAVHLPPLRVTANRRFLETADGKPFFWLADTAWQLLHDLDEAEMRHYFADRRDKGFTVVQTVALAELRGHTPNAFGHLPIEPKRPDRPLVKPGPDNDYWDDVERAIRLADENGLYVGLLPTWGKHVISNWQNGLVDGFFTAENAEAYGRFIGARLKDLGNIVWILGGDRAAPTDASRAIWRAMARGIAIGTSGREDYGSVLMTYHTSGPGSTAWFLNNEPWMDFHGLQSGHGRWVLNWQMVEHAYGMKPTVPVIDLETSYPGFRHGRPPTIATDDDARRAAYWAVFAGAAGHTFGHHSIWQMHSPIYPGVAGPKEFWFDALDAPSARQAGCLRRLVESRPFLTQRPDLSLLAFEQVKPWEMCLALRGDGYAMIYTPTGRPLKVRMNRIAGAQIKAWWINPRTGEPTAIGEFPNSGEREFTPPTGGENHDWVLVLDDATRKLTPPGKPL